MSAPVIATGSAWCQKQASGKVRGVDTVRRTRIKICGITRIQDAEAADHLGADSIGFVFVAASRRYISIENAQAISEQVSPFVTRIGLFLNAPADEVWQVLEAIPELIPQFHGQESAAFCEQFGRTYLKAIGLGGGLPEPDYLDSFEHAGGFLFDSNKPGQLGGTGHLFDWRLLGQIRSGRMILAGGLNASNVREAIRLLSPYAVDVSSGVESSKGIKDAAAIATFVNAVKAADRQASSLAPAC